MQTWLRLTTETSHVRFAEIMRQMDDRYSGLSIDELQHWLQRKEASEKNPGLYGWFAGDPTDPANIRQVMAVTSSQDEDGHRSDVGISMLGITADVIPEPLWTPENIKLWLSRFVLCVKGLIGLDANFRAIRPKTMTWKPAEQLHDLMKTGIEFDSDDPTEGRLLVGVFQEKDLGDSLYWKMRIVRVNQQPPNESDATGVLGESLSVQR
ncbi:hypothetical protein CA54_59350 [Symmachiella macrocystis]|uniref:Uncharacterized protein n=1 Tax=Symmachiella macrocystis TaxID=2527985 RepID=A0A5C6B0E6_9PLAN|nr:hypothetical protein [Symmachiella macrocystis]TWU05247.1 hypothetical protein CA54_59350 [Symmachiella macrocystis]